MFKEIPETNGSYSCDENGNIRSNERWVFNNGSGCWYRIQERILKPYVTNKGYHVVDLRIDGETKRFLVNRLVAITWIPNPDNLPIINHKDNDPLNNHYTNLEWCTYQYNTCYSIVQGRHHYDSPYGYIWRFKSDENVTTNNEYQNS